MTRLGTGLATLLGTLALSMGEARAAPGEATRLDYARSQRAANCPGREALESAVSKRLGYDPFFHAARQTIVVAITDADEGLRAQLHLVDANGLIIGSRELRDRTDNCPELVAALALAISIALDPSAALGEPEPAPLQTKPVTESAPAESATTKDEVVVPAETQAPRPAHAGTPDLSVRTGGDPHATNTSLRLTGFGALGSAPSAAAGVRIGTSRGFGSLRLVAEFSDQRSASRGATDGGAVAASLVGGLLAPCLASGSFSACALGELGAFRAEGQDIENPVRKRSLYLALGGRLEYTPRIFGIWRLVLNADVTKSLTPIELRLRGVTVWGTPFASVSMAAGIAVQFR